MSIGTNGSEASTESPRRSRRITRVKGGASQAEKDTVADDSTDESSPEVTKAKPKGPSAGESDAPLGRVRKGAKTNPEPACDGGLDYGPARPQARSTEPLDESEETRLRLARVGAEVRPKSRVGRARSRPSVAGRGVVAAVAFSALLTIIGGAVGYSLAELQSDIWGAEAEVVLGTTETQVDRFLSTQVVLAKSRSALDAAAEVVEVDRQYIEESLGVSPIEASLALRFRFDDPDPDLAVEVVDAVMAAYLTQIEEASTDTTRAVYENRIEVLRASRAEVEVDLARFETLNAAAVARDEAPPFPTEERRLTLESAQLLEQVAGLEQQLLVTDIQLLNRAQPNVVSAPALLDGRVSPAPLTFAALGALMAGVIAAGTVLLIGQRRSLLDPQA